MAHTSPWDRDARARAASRTRGVISEWSTATRILSYIGASPLDTRNFRHLHPVRTEPKGPGLPRSRAAADRAGDRGRACARLYARGTIRLLADPDCAVYAPSGAHLRVCSTSPSHGFSTARRRAAGQGPTSAIGGTFCGGPAAWCAGQRRGPRPGTGEPG